MNEKAEQLIIDASEKVLAYLEATEGFAVEQAPLLAQEIVARGVWWNGLWLFTGYSMFLVLAALSLHHGRETSDWDGPTPHSVLSIAFGGCAFFAFTVSTVRVLPDFVKALVAPRLYIIEQIGGLLG